MAVDWSQSILLSISEVKSLELGAMAPTADGCLIKLLKNLIQSLFCKAMVSLGGQLFDRGIPGSSTKFVTFADGCYMLFERARDSNTP